jgi:dihydroorotate dehydrogenase (fumarate)
LPHNKCLSSKEAENPFVNMASLSTEGSSTCGSAPQQDDGKPVATDEGSEQQISLSTTVARIALQKVLLNSSNPFATTVDDLQSLADSPATGAFATRTACPNFEHDDAKHQWCEYSEGNTINCLGYSCHTFDYYIDAIKKVQSSTSSAASMKPAVFSISGYANEIADMLKQLAAAFVLDDSTSTPPQLLIEINLSCPNIPGKPPIAYDFEGMKGYLTTVFHEGNHGLNVGVKLTPYFYDGQFVEAAKVLNEFFPNLSFVTSINTVGCGLMVDIETEAPILASAAPGASYGGLGGPAVHATALGNVRRLRQVLRPELDVVGCGGVNSGAAAFRHLLCGAQAVMVASSLLTEGVGVFERIESELVEIMQRKGYSSIGDFQGKLKEGGGAAFSCPTSRS